MIFNWVSEKWRVRVRTVSIGSRQDPVVGSIKGAEFLDNRSDSQILKLELFAKFNSLNVK